MPTNDDPFETLVEESCTCIERRLISQSEPALASACELALKEDGEDSPKYRAIVDLLRVTREYSGDLAGAAIDKQEVSHDEALRKARFSYSAENRQVYIKLIAAFTNAAWSGLRFELARRFLLTGFDLWRWNAIESADYARYAETTLWLGDISLGAGAYGPAYLLFEEIRRLCALTDIGDQWRFGALTGLGRTWLGLGESSTGQALLEQVLLQQKAMPTRWRDATRDLYESYLDASNFDGASRCYEVLLASGDPKGTSQEEIAARQKETANPSNAVMHYTRLINPSPGVSVPSSAVMRISLRLIKLHLAQGSLQQSYELFKNAYPLHLEVKGQDHPAMSNLDEIGAELEYALGRPESALLALFRATKRDSRVAPLQLSAGSPAVRNRLLAAMRRRTEAAVALVASHFSQEMKYIGGVLALTNRRKGLNVNIEWQKIAQLQRAAASGREAREIQGELRSVRSLLARETLLQTRGPSVEPSQVENLLHKKEDLENRASFVIGGVSIEGLTDAPSPTSIAMCIPQSSAYIEFINYRPLPGEAGVGTPSRYCAIVLRARYLQWSLVDLGSASEIEPAIEHFRSSIAGDLLPERSLAALPDPLPERTPDYVSTGERLRRMLFDPLIPLIGSQSRLVICADGLLFSLPFECLPSGEGNLIDLYRINYVLSSRDVMYMDSNRIHGPEDAANCSPPLLMGCPDYDLSKGDGISDATFRFGPLPGTKDEVEAIASLLGVAALLSEEASKVILDKAESPLILHLATHGFVLREGAIVGELSDMPLLRCGIALAGANARDATGIVTGEEALSINLQHTALAVLSACETGLGLAEHGEGLASLGRAFGTAGAAAILIGLWKVPDQSTRSLMELFYGNLVKGLTCADSLHNAKLELRKANPNPFHWAAFICLGRWGSIDVHSYSKLPEQYSRGPNASFKLESSDRITRLEEPHG